MLTLFDTSFFEVMNILYCKRACYSNLLRKKYKAQAFLFAGTSL